MSKRPSAAKKARQLEVGTAFLRERFPQLYIGEVRPLAIGASAEIYAAAKEAGVSRCAASAALRWLVTGIDYQLALARHGSRRIHLDGSDAGEVEQCHRERAYDEAQRIRREIRAGRKAAKAATRPEAKPVEVAIPEPGAFTQPAIPEPASKTITLKSPGTLALPQTVRRLDQLGEALGVKSAGPAPGASTVNLKRPGRSERVIVVETRRRRAL